MTSEYRSCGDGIIIITFEGWRWGLRGARPRDSPPLRLQDDRPPCAHSPHRGTHREVAAGCRRRPLHRIIQRGTCVDPPDAVDKKKAMRSHPSSTPWIGARPAPGRRGSLDPTPAQALSCGSSGKPWSGDQPSPKMRAMARSLAAGPDSPWERRRVVSVVIISCLQVRVSSLDVTRQREPPLEGRGSHAAGAAVWVGGRVDRFDQADAEPARRREVLRVRRSSLRRGRAR